MLNRLGRMPRCTSRHSTRSLEIAYESAESWVRAVFPLEELAACKTLASVELGDTISEAFSDAQLSICVTGLRKNDAREAPARRRGRSGRVRPATKRDDARRGPEEEVWRPARGVVVVHFYQSKKPQKQPEDLCSQSEHIHQI